MQSGIQSENFKTIQDVDDIFRPDLSEKEAQQLYLQWAELGTYDKIMGKGSFEAPEQLRKAMDGLFPQPEKVLILDVGAGTGVNGKNLRELGYTNIQALEPNPAFAKVLKEKGNYTKIIQAFIGGDTPLDIPDDTYDAIVTSGTFVPGHLPCSSLPEMVRIVKPGGFVVNCMREEYTWTVKEYKDRLLPLIDQLENEGRWKKVRREIYPNHFPNKNGILMVYQVC